MQGLVPPNVAPAARVYPFSPCLRSCKVRQDYNYSLLFKGALAILHPVFAMLTAGNTAPESCIHVRSSETASSASEWGLEAERQLLEQEEVLMMQQQQVPACPQCVLPLHWFHCSVPSDSTPHVPRLLRRVKWPPVSKAVLAVRAMRFHTYDSHPRHTNNLNCESRRFSIVWYDLVLSH